MSYWNFVFSVSGESGSLDFGEMTQRHEEIHSESRGGGGGRGKRLIASTATSHPKPNQPRGVDLNSKSIKHLPTSSQF